MDWRSARSWPLPHSSGPICSTWVPTSDWSSPLTVVAICVWSATVAAALPLLLRRLRVDPAVVSAPLITTLVDGTGLIIYFEIARLVLSL